MEWSFTQEIPTNNSILKNKERIKMVEALKGKYRVFVLSNINTMHANWCDTRLMDQFDIDGISGLFHDTVLSHEVNLRKPESDIFNHLLKEMDIRPFETLFIDDKPENIETAIRLNMNAIQYITKDKLFENLLKVKIVL